MQEKKKDYEFSFEELKGILTKCIAWNPKSITLSGGEPICATGNLFLPYKFDDGKYRQFDV